MLILTRRVDEAIIINEDIYIKVIRINTRQVALGINTPIGMPIHREEIQRRIDEQRLFDKVCYGEKL